MEKKEVHLILKQGEDYFAKGDLIRAESTFKAILESHPNHTETLNNLGVIAFHNSNYEQACKYLRKAVEIDTENSEAIENLAQLFMTMGDYNEALKMLQRAYEMGNINTKLLNTMAESFLRLGDTPTAIEVFHESLNRDSDQEEVKNFLKNIEKNAFLSKENLNYYAANEKLNIGFVTIWFERGQAYVTKTLIDVLSRQHNTFVFARTGAVYGEPKLETNNFWDVTNLTTYSEYQIPPDVLISWIKENHLDAVIFNEEYDWGLIKAAKSTGVKVLTYLDYYKEDWKPFMSLYDKVLCSTQRTYHLVKDLCNAHFIGWAVDTDLFRPSGNGERKYTFFHNAGWLGINYRKMTPAVILAFDAVSRHLPDVTLFIHSQADLDKLPPAIIRIISSNPRITYHMETLPAPGLYHKGKILVFPSKLEGLGLPLSEGLACGLPAIVTDAPPMNEFVKDDYNGLLVRVVHRSVRSDNIAFPEELIDINDLTLKMAKTASDPQRLEKMSKNARLFAKTELSLNLMENRLSSLLCTIFEHKNRQIKGE
jgi:glycosyltransferase involved in cell wall biosynthesis